MEREKLKIKFTYYINNKKHIKKIKLIKNNITWNLLLTILCKSFHFEEKDKISVVYQTKIIQNDEDLWDILFVFFEDSIALRVVYEGNGGRAVEPLIDLSKNQSQLNQESKQGIQYEPENSQNIDEHVQKLIEKSKNLYTKQSEKFQLQEEEEESQNKKDQKVTKSNLERKLQDIKVEESVYVQDNDQPQQKQPQSINIESQHYKELIQEMFKNKNVLQLIQKHQQKIIERSIQQNPGYQSQEGQGLKNIQIETDYEKLSMLFCKELMQTMNNVKPTNQENFSKQQKQRKSQNMDIFNDSIVKRCQRSVIRLKRKMVNGKLKFIAQPEIEEYSTIIIDKSGKQNFIEEPFEVAKQSFFVSKQNAQQNKQLDDNPIQVQEEEDINLNKEEVKVQKPIFKQEEDQHINKEEEEKAKKPLLKEEQPIKTDKEEVVEQPYLNQKEVKQEESKDEEESNNEIQCPSYWNY